MDSEVALMLTFMLVIAAMGLVMTALTHAELRRPVNIEPKSASNVPTGVQLFIWLLVTAIVALTLLGIVGWIVEVFK